MTWDRFPKFNQRPNPPVVYDPVVIEDSPDVDMVDSNNCNENGFSENQESCSRTSTCSGSISESNAAVSSQPKVILAEKELRDVSTYSDICAPVAAPYDDGASHILKSREYLHKERMTLLRPHSVGQYSTIITKSIVSGLLIFSSLCILFSFYRDLSSRLLAEYESANQSIFECRKQFLENHCKRLDDYDGGNHIALDSHQTNPSVHSIVLPPVLHGMCMKWQTCMSRTVDDVVHNRLSIAARTLAEAVNEFSSSISIKGLIVTLAVVVTYVVISVSDWSKKDNSGGWKHATNGNGNYSALKQTGPVPSIPSIPAPLPMLPSD